MTGLQFARPYWVHLIWLVVTFTGLLVWLDGRGNDRLDRFISRAMQQRLVSGPARWRRLMRIGLLGLAAFWLVLALMRPQWGLRYVQTPRVGAQIMICLDVSRSMLATDAAPTRLERAKAEIQDMLTLLDRDHVGLIAFAGTATVLCPMTPDFGFLRMVLDTVTPNSVARGGTDLEVPIRKAVAGFTGASELSRAIILITDGEDHESFAMDAAAAAAERGIRIIAIGFGAESGSPVVVTDPRTGARTQLLDGNGKPVISRLDGQLLRQMALKTDGAYIPAGTGALDLKSIYDAYIAPLTRGRLDDRGHLVKEEGFQWMVLLALVSLVVACVAASRRPGLSAKTIGSPHAAVMAAVVILWAIAGTPGWAQSDDQVVNPAQAAATGTTVEDRGQGKEQDQKDKKPIDPRAAYNQAVAMLQANKLDDAQERFLLARRYAQADGRVRYRATYNLSWVEVSRADQVIQKEPAQALAHLNNAAAYLRDAIRLQPDEVAPRENLQMVTRRAMALADAIAQKDKPDLGAQIDELIDQQRQLAMHMQSTIERVADLAGPAVPEAARVTFRELEIQQRHILSSVDQVAEEARQELDQLEAINKDEQSSEQLLRMAQVTGVGTYLHRAVQRMGQVRQQLRQCQANRAYRRASVGLSELKRARDQLKDLTTLLRTVIDDAAVLAQQTGLLATTTDPALLGQNGRQPVPRWLTRPYLEEALTAVRQRIDELLARIKAGIPDKDQAEANDGTDQRLMDRLQAAAPLVQEASGAMRQADQALVSQRDLESYQSQASAVAALMEAHELFLDVRGLVEVIYSDQRRLQAVIDQVAVDRSIWSELRPLAGQVQAANIQRGGRLGDLIDQQLQAFDTSEPSKASPEADSSQRQTFQLARQLLAPLMSTFDQLAAMIGSSDEPASSLAELDLLKTKANESVAQIEAVRRLFLTMVEHIRQAANKQIELADDTRDAATGIDADPQGKTDPQTNDQVGPLLDRQRRLSDLAQQIADALDTQSQQSPADAPAPGPDAGALEQGSQDSGHRLAQAGDRVHEATQAMGQAIGVMAGDPVDLDKAQEHQTVAIQKLASALELLAPPPHDQKKDQEQDQENQQDQQQSQQSQAAQQEQSKDEQQDQAQQMNAQRLLQAVRDRQAQRQRERGQKRPTGYTPVEKDW